MLGQRWAVLDPIAAIIVSIFILKAAWGLIGQSTAELLEASLPKNVEEEILALVCEESLAGVVHNLRTRRIGNRIAMEMHVRMPGALTLYEAHRRATIIEQRIRNRFGADTLITLHLEPRKVNGRYEQP